MKYLFRAMLLTVAVLAGGPDALWAQKPLGSVLKKITASSSAKVPYAGAEKLRAVRLWAPSYWAPYGKNFSRASFSPLVKTNLKTAVARQVSARRSLVLPTFPDKKTVDAVIFDLDGTLLDSLGAWEHSGTNFLRSQGIVPPDGLDEELVKMSLMDGARLLKHQFHLPQTPEEILRLTLEPIRQRYFNDIAPKPGVKKLLKRLHQQGIRMCVATASDRELAYAALKRTGLLDYFEFIITCDEVGVGKRNPAVYEKAAQKLGTQKSRTLVAEDALYAVRTAKKAGFLTAAVAEEHAAAEQEDLLKEADYYFRSFADALPKK